MRSPVIKIKILDYCYSYTGTNRVSQEPDLNMHTTGEVKHRPGDVVELPERQALTLIGRGKAELA